MPPGHPSQQHEQQGSGQWQANAHPPYSSSGAQQIRQDHVPASGQEYAPASAQQDPSAWPQQTRHSSQPHPQQPQLRHGFTVNGGQFQHHQALSGTSYNQGPGESINQVHPPPPSFPVGQSFNPQRVLHPSNAFVQYPGAPHPSHPSHLPQAQIPPGGYAYPPPYANPQPVYLNHNPSQPQPHSTLQYPPAPQPYNGYGGPQDPQDVHRTHLLGIPLGMASTIQVQPSGAGGVQDPDATPPVAPATGTALGVSQTRKVCIFNSPLSKTPSSPRRHVTRKANHILRPRSVGGCSKTKPSI